MAQLKKCSKCKSELSLSMFSKDKTKIDGIYNSCKKCKTSQRRTKNGILTDIYSSQKLSSKTRGQELPNYTKEELIEWAFSKKEFHCLYEKWVVSGYEKYLKHSFDRLDDYKSYSLSNLRIVTWKENETKSHNDRMSGKNNKQSKAVAMLTLDGELVMKHYSINSASRKTGINRVSIKRACQGERKTAGKHKWKYI